MALVPPANCVELEHAHRAVPDDGARGLELRGQFGGGFGPMSKIRSSSATSVAFFTVATGIGGKGLGGHHVGGIGTSAPRAAMAAMTALASPSQIGFGQRFADLAGPQPA